LERLSYTWCNTLDAGIKRIGVAVLSPTAHIVTVSHRIITFAVQAIPATHPANVAFLVAHPLLGYHKHWQVYCEERQDLKRELNARGKASNVRLVSFSYPPEVVTNARPAAVRGEARQTGAYQAGSSSAGSSAAAAAHYAAGGFVQQCEGQASGVPGPQEVSYMVHPSEIAGSDRVLAAPAAPAPAVPATTAAAAAAVPAVAPVARVPVAAASAVPHVGPRQEMQQQLQLLAGPRASACSLGQLRSIIASQKCLGHINTSGNGRNAATVQAELAAALQQMLSGGGGLSYQHLKQQQQRLQMPGIGMKDLKAVKEALDPWLSYVRVAGAGRFVAVVQQELLQAVCALIDLHVGA
jgi:hypothetical protein